MAGNANQKSKLLNILDIFLKNTDENNVLSATDLCYKLESRGIKAERKSIYSDIEILRGFGYEIISTRTPKNGYFLASREFEIAEIRLLMDAVQAANFISLKKTKDLIFKISSLTNEQQAKGLNERVYIDNRLKCSNEEIYYSIDCLNEAIQKGKQVSFIYRKRKVEENNTVYYEEKPHTVNPYALIWSNDHYYLIANNIKYDNLMTTRIDRMKKVTILNERARSFKEVSEYKTYFDSADYAAKHLNMFSGESKPIELICNNDLVEIIMDKFGEKVPIYPFDDNCFLAKFNSAINDGLISWIIQFGSKIKVKSPNQLKMDIVSRAESIICEYK